MSILAIVSQQRKPNMQQYCKKFDSAYMCLLCNLTESEEMHAYKYYSPAERNCVPALLKQISLTAS
jgi:hypothetical protein